MSSAPHDPRPQQGRPTVIAGELVPPQGAVHPGARSYDPLAQPGPAQGSGSAPSAAGVQPYAAPPAGGVQPYGAPPQPHPGAAQAGYGMHPPVPVMLPQPKSVAVAFVLTFFFGAFGMFYSTVSGALIMLAVVLLGGFVLGALFALISVLTLGIGSFLFLLLPVVGFACWIISMVWGCTAVSAHNQKVAAQHMAAGFPPPVM